MYKILAPIFYVMSVGCFVARYVLREDVTTTSGGFNSLVNSVQRYTTTTSNWDQLLPLWYAAGALFVLGIVFTILAATEKK